MPPVNYVHLYILALVAFIGSALAGIFFFYSGMGELSFTISDGMRNVQYFFDKNQYDFYMIGLIYSATFLVVGVLLLGFILVPTPEQLQQRVQMAAYGATPQSNRGAAMAPTIAPPVQMAPPPVQMAPPPMQMAPPPVQPPPAAAPPGAAPPGTAPEAAKAVEKEPEPEEKMPTTIISGSKKKEKEEAQTVVALEEMLDEDDFDGYDDGASSVDIEESDVVYGNGRINDKSIIDYINRYPDSAIKFLFRRNLDGKPIQQTDEEIYRVWQKRGMARSKVKDYICQIMEWEKLPDIPLHELWTQLRDQIFEMTH